MAQGKAGTANLFQRIKGLKLKQKKGTITVVEEKELEAAIKSYEELKEKEKQMLIQTRKKIVEDAEKAITIEPSTGKEMSFKPATEVYYSQLRESTRLKAYHHPDELIHDIDVYFRSCYTEVNGKSVQIRPFTLSGLANAIGVDRRTLANYGDPNYPKQFDETLAPIINRARSIIEQQLEEGLMWDKGNAGGKIFVAKNSHGWKDESKVISEKVEPVKINYIAPTSENESTGE